MSRKGKNKGQKFQKRISEDLGRLYGLKAGKDDHFGSRPMGNTGADIRMSPRAREVCPFDIECKRKKKYAISKFMKDSFQQTLSNTQDDRIPLLLVREDYGQPYAFFRWEDLIKLIKFVEDEQEEERDKVDELLVELNKIRHEVIKLND